jgi:hypothetical protein
MPKAEAQKNCSAYFDREAHQKPAVVRFGETARDQFPSFFVKNLELVYFFAPIFSYIYTTMPLRRENIWSREKRKKEWHIMSLACATSLAPDADVIDI